MPVDNLEDMFVYQLEEMYAVERKLVDVLGDLASDATDDELEKGFTDHREETRQHVERVEKAFEALGYNAEGRESKVLDAMVEERREFVDQTPRGELHDLFDLQAGIKTERMEITGYEGLLALAEKLDLSDDVTRPLERNLDSEESALKELEALSKGSKAQSFISKLLG